MRSGTFQKFLKSFFGCRWIKLLQCLYVMPVFLLQFKPNEREPSSAACCIFYKAKSSKHGSQVHLIGASYTVICI